MKNHTTTNLLYLMTAGFVLVVVNAGVWMAVQNGQLSPVGHPGLWGAFMLLNMVSLLWAVGLLGLQPLVVACSYAVGGFVAYRGVQGMAGISVAEVTTAGATYGAIGALAVGNATTKVRMAFFRKGQTPFIFVIVGLLVVSGFLNSQVSEAGWTVILNGLILPFSIAGIVVGLVWMVISRLNFSRKPHVEEKFSKEETIVIQPHDEDEDEGASQLMFQVPEAIEEEDEPEELSAMLATPEPIQEGGLGVDEPPVELAVPDVEEEIDDGHFFPLEIDKDDEFALPYEEVVSVEPDFLEENIEPEQVPDLPQEMILKPELVSEYIPEPEPIVEPELISEFIPELEPVSVRSPVLEAAEPLSEPHEDESDETDWLNSHLDLMNKISSKNE